MIKTLGGLQFWTDIHFFRDYRIQENVLTNRCRLLDRHHWQLACGTYENCFSKLKNIREQQNLEPMAGQAVILLHGILRDASYYSRMRDALEKRGYLVFPMNYASTRMTIEQAAEKLQQAIASLEGVESIHLIGHSMGGLVIRAWFGLQESAPIVEQQIGKVVMLGTPNQGADLADMLDSFRPARWLFGPAGRQLQTNQLQQQQFAVPSVPFAIIAGGRGEATNGYNPLLEGDDDGTVTVASTQLEGARDTLVIPCLHLFLVKNRQAITAIESFLEYGHFNTPAVKPQPIQQADEF